MSLYRIGVDVGGTNTDAAILDIKASGAPSRGVLSSCKVSTTEDITSGITEAIDTVLRDSTINKSRVLSVTIGTTHFINALVEADARRLSRVAVVRLCGAFTRQIPPFSDFPTGLRGVIDGGVYYLDGGFEIDGRQIDKINPQQIRELARTIAASGVRTVAVVGVFSPLDCEEVQEVACKQILLEEHPGLRVVCSHQIGPLGLLERENATILNAAILDTADKVVKGFQRAMTRLDLSCPLYLSQNDGTLIESQIAAKFPIRTFASGPTNSMMGAAFLAGLDTLKSGIVAEHGEDSAEPQILVVDIGGTTTDVCALQRSGRPRQAPGFVDVCGVRTAFSMPEVASIGLGGGSKIVLNSSGDFVEAIGPASVGHYIQQEAKVFGGQTLTLTDIVVASGRAQLGDPGLVRDIPNETIDSVGRLLSRMLESIIEKMKVTSAPVHILLVGGGAIVVNEELKNVEKCIRPIHQGAANAVGAAIAKVAGEVDTVEMLDRRSERELVQAACDKAVDLAVQRGASRSQVRVVEVNKIPLQYTANPAMRIQARAIGPLDIPDESSLSWGTRNGHHDETGASQQDYEGEKANIPNALDSATQPSLSLDLQAYRPDVRKRVWYVSEVDLQFISTGCGVLGTGGGGPTHYEYLKALHSLRHCVKGTMRIISPKDLSNDQTICFGSWYGSPSVLNERIPGGNEIPLAIEVMKRVVGRSSFDGVLADEIGGGNGLSVFPTGVDFDIPVVDGDAMGRAFPTMYHATFSVYGHPMTPCVLADARGNSTVVMSVDSPFRLEKVLRSASIELGLGCAVAANPLPGSAIKSHGVHNSLSMAWYLGRAIHTARYTKQDFLAAIFDISPGKVLFTGKIVDVLRHVTGGYTVGTVIIEPASDDTDDRDAPPSSNACYMKIPFQNEYLYAALSDSQSSEGSQEVVCSVPDLISILDQNGEAIGSQDLRYGLHVSVVAFPSHPLWKTEQALEIGGPKGFGLDIPVVGVDDDFVEFRSVIDEFDQQ